MTTILEEINPSGFAIYFNMAIHTLDSGSYSLAMIRF